MLTALIVYYSHTVIVYFSLEHKKPLIELNGDFWFVCFFFLHIINEIKYFFVRVEAILDLMQIKIRHLLDNKLDRYEGVSMSGFTLF